MKKIFTLSFALLAVTAFAQIPAGYYNNATGTGYTLKTQLRDIITNGHNPNTYNGLWSLYTASIRDNFYENDGTILDIYSENPSGTDPYTYEGPSDQCGNYSAEGQCYNREHLIPKSYFNDQLPMYSDAHHVVPSDGKVNGWRGNLPFGVVGTANNPCNSGATNTPCHSQNNSKVGNNVNSGYSAGFSGKVFEPIDEFKGDIARTYFYFATRYQNQMPQFYTSATDTEVKVMFNGTADVVFSPAFLNILLAWHAMDPVSEKEISFNNAIYTFQGNRNPFIDNPQFVNTIWGTAMGIEDVFSARLSVYPNPATNSEVKIYSEVQLDEIQLISINGQIIQQISKPQPDNNEYTMQNLPQGFYLLRLSGEGNTITKKVIVN